MANNPPAIVGDLLWREKNNNIKQWWEKCILSLNSLKDGFHLALTNGNEQSFFKLKLSAAFLGEIIYKLLFINAS